MVKKDLIKKIREAKEEVELRYEYRFVLLPGGEKDLVELTILKVDGKVVFSKNEEIDEKEWEILCEEIQDKACDWIQEEIQIRNLDDDWIWSDDLKDVVFNNGLYVCDVVNYWENNYGGWGEKGVITSKEGIKKAFEQALKEG